MNFNDHISTVCKKASQRVGVIMRLRNLIPTAAKLQLYKAVILPHLTNTAREPHYLLYLTDDSLQDIAIRMFKVKHSLCTQNISDSFNLHSSHYNLRTAEFVIPRFNTVTYGKHSTEVHAP